MSILNIGAKERVWKCFECGWEYPYSEYGYNWDPMYSPICAELVGATVTTTAMMQCLIHKE